MRGFISLLLLDLAGVCAAAPQPAEPGAALLSAIRATAPDPEACYRVRDLDLSKEDLRLYFSEGYLIFSKPVNGERISAVFSGDVEGGDGEVLLLPPYRGERMSLARFTSSPNLDEHFRAAVLIFTDGSAQALLDRITHQNGGRPAPEMGPPLAAEWSGVMVNLATSFDLRLAQELLTPPAGRSGFLFATVAGKKLGNFDLFYDARAPEQIAAGQLVERAGRPVYDVWTSFAARSFRNGSAKPPSRMFEAEQYRIDTSLDATLRLKATVHLTLRTGVNPVRALPFDVSRAIQITGARMDGAPAQLLFHESFGGRILREGENDPFVVIAPAELAPGSVHEIQFEEEGSVITQAGNGVYYVGARANWYPRGGADFSTYDLTFHYLRRLTLVTTGGIAEDHTDGDWRVTRWVTPVPIRLAGFNLGDYEKITGAPSGFHVEVYGNRRLEAALQPRVQYSVPESEAAAPPPLSGRGGGGGRRGIPPLPTPSLPNIPDPLARLRAVAADVNSALQFFSGLFGPPALPSLTVAPIPGTFGQGFPGLVYLSTLSYLDPTARPTASRGSREQVFFSDLIEAHEVAHQWWGNVVVPAGYQDEWIPEALANYSAIMYLEKKKGTKAAEDLLADYRDGLVKKNSDGQTIESSGPITWGYRLESSASTIAWHDITYNKGAWIFHMLRRRMGDDRFLKMLAELRRRYEKRAVSTADLRALVEQYLPPRMAGASIDAFFDNWVYSTGIPELKLRYTVKGLRLSGQVEQSGVDDGFSIDAPVEVQFAKGAPQTIWVETSNAGASFSATLKQVPVRVSIPAGTSILAVKK